MALEINNLIKKKIDKKHLQKIAEVAIKKINLKNEPKISLAIVGEKRIRDLNKKYRAQDKITDVLSFNLLDRQSPDKILGEIFLCYHQAQKQAHKNNVPLKAELTRLLVHGILHLAGYTHQKKEDRFLMEKKEKEILNGLKSKI